MVTIRKADRRDLWRVSANIAGFQKADPKDNPLSLMVPASTVDQATTLLSTDQEVAVFLAEVPSPSPFETSKSVGMICAVLQEAPLEKLGGGSGVAMAGMLYVHKGAPYKTANLLIATAADWCCDMGAGFVTIAVTAKNLRRRAYKRLGFRFLCRDSNGQAILIARTSDVVSETSRWET